MTFWQENFSFIKDVYDSRSSKLIELMDKTDKAMAAVLADKIYTSNEFKKVKEIFTGLARSLEQPDTKEWLTITKDTLLTDRPNEQDEESGKLKALLERYDAIMPKIDDTKKAVDCLWKAYQFTDELAPYMDWMEETRSKSTRDVNSNGAPDTEDLIDKQDKLLHQVDQKKKSVLEQIAKGEKILADPKSPKFLDGHVNKMKGLWDEANKVTVDRLQTLKENLAAWERYETKRDALGEKLTAANKEFNDTRKVFDLATTSNDHATRTATAAAMRKDIEETFASLSEANGILARLMGETKKGQLADEVSKLSAKMKILDSMDEKLKNLDEFIKKLKDFDKVLKEMETWNVDGRKRMDDLLNPPKPLLPEERVMYTMELQSDIEAEIAKHAKHNDEVWKSIEPTEAAEKTDEAAEFVSRMAEVSKFQNTLLDEVKAEGEKFGEDIKHLADFTSGCKKFEPWIATAEAKKSRGVPKPKNLEEARAFLADAQKWKQEATDMNTVLANAKASAHKMTIHDDPDVKHEAYVKRWAVIDAAADDWIKQLESMVDVWQKQADTAAKVTAAIAAPADGEGAGEMKLEDLEKHLNSLKEMFIEKQKMMAQLEKTGGEGAAPAAAAATPAAPAAPAPAADPPAS